MIVDRDWLLWPPLFTGEQCDRLIAASHAIEDMAGDMTRKPDLPLPEVRSSRLRWLHRNNPAFGPFFALADAAFAEGQRIFGVRTDPFDALQFTEYHAARRGHYDWHRDDFPDEKKSYDRLLSLCIQLSDPASYAGGALELQVANPPPPAVIRARGSAVMFRSSTKHRVSPTVAGTRYSAVAWALGRTPL